MTIALAAAVLWPLSVANGAAGAESTLPSPVPGLSVSGQEVPGREASDRGASGRNVSGQDLSAAAVPLEHLTVSTTQVAFGLRRPTAVSSPDDGTGRLFILEKPGRIRVYHPDTGLAADPLLDIQDRVDSSDNERGLLGIAPAPDFATSQVLYLAYTRLSDGAVTLSRFRLSATGATEEVLLTQEHATFTNHNGGELAFGPDGYLYLSIGDGGGAGDSLGSGQNLGTLLGKILRLDVDSACGDLPYCVPADNPFVDTPGARPEIWAYGLRNPWRFSFDPADGSLWIADVGQGGSEEINHLAADQAGANLGWSCREGTEQFDPTRCEPGAVYTDPVFTYPTSVEGCAVIGGHVYRGERFADIAGGTYVASDYCSAAAWAVRANPDGTHTSARIGEFPIQVTAFGTDADGELYVVNDLPGGLHRVSFESTAPAPTCAVNYRVASQWGTGFTASVTVTNTGTEPIDGWRLAWTFPADQRVTSAWDAAITQQGATATATNLGWNGRLAPGASTTFGFLATGGGPANPTPTTFHLNGAPCA
ncbi:PQQ-dependent sugar dehydrogenase [Allostreptomyces psammosilenae]|uniref:Glucose/arabinose dehydrogenase n=1 Tax=Allostreptomyces psammosilenae TaxID=1892865 RepID=A0A853A777_9ACTN|nr:PQQ-dependent sugar dehydrogenase [Allostreptomyces psammosilenae]NYI06398.1 glucose/arabinose dehydrogenase [Allostreptomyces psammosilenae]